MLLLVRCSGVAVFCLIQQTLGRVPYLLCVHVGVEAVEAPVPAVQLGTPGARGFLFVAPDFGVVAGLARVDLPCPCDFLGHCGVVLLLLLLCFVFRGVRCFCGVSLLVRLCLHEGGQPFHGGDPPPCAVVPYHVGHFLSACDLAVGGSLVDPDLRHTDGPCYVPYGQLHV